MSFHLRNFKAIDQWIEKKIGKCCVNFIFWYNVLIKKQAIKSNLSGSTSSAKSEMNAVYDLHKVFPSRFSYRWKVSFHLRNLKAIDQWIEKMGKVLRQFCSSFMFDRQYNVLIKKQAIKSNSSGATSSAESEMNTLDDLKKIFPCRFSYRWKVSFHLWNLKRIDQ